MRLSVVLLALVAAPAFAQQAAPLDKVYACASIADSPARLACFDDAVASLKHADAAGGVAVVDRAQIEKAEKEAFGLATPSLSELASSARAASSAPAAPAQTATATATTVVIATPAARPAGPIDRVTMAIKSAEKKPDGTFRFVMENGQIWQQIDTTILGSLGQGPWTAEIRKAALGSFLLKVNNRTAVRVKRLE